MLCSKYPDHRRTDPSQYPTLEQALTATSTIKKPVAPKKPISLPTSPLPSLRPTPVRDMDCKTRHPSSRSDASNDVAARQRRDFWHTVLSKDASKDASIEHLSDSEYSGLRLSGEQKRPKPAMADEVGPYSPSHGSHRKETPCPICQAMFKRKYDLLQHISAVHEKNRPFKCETCESSFAHKGTLSKHVRTVHKRERPYVCEHCGLRFSERGNVNKHKQRAQSCRAAEEQKTRSGRGAYSSRKAN